MSKAKYWHVFQRKRIYRVGHRRLFGFIQWARYRDDVVYEAINSQAASHFAEMLNDEIDKDHEGPSKWAQL